MIESSAYDAYKRLRSAQETNNNTSKMGWIQPYLIDAQGNRAVDPSGYILNADLTPTALSQFTNNQWIPGSGYKYDGGNQTSTGSKNSPGTAANVFTFDGENRMVTANIANTGNVTYAYDGEGRRVQKTVGAALTNFVYDTNGNLVAEYSDIAPREAGTQYLFDDHLGSTRLVVDGTTVKRYDYLPFGEEIPSGMDGRGSDYGAQAVVPSTPDVVNQKFTGKERDNETGLDYFDARYFSSAQGRFTSPDWSVTPQPVPYADLADPQTLNLYGYVRNDPLSKDDPNGHCCLIYVDPQKVQDFAIGWGKGLVNAYLNEAASGEKTPAALIGKGLSALGVQQQAASNADQASGMANSPLVTSAIAMAIPAGGGAKSETLPDEAIVVRGGTNKPENFINGSGVRVAANGNLSGVSVNSAAGKSEAELSQGIPNNQIGVTTVGQVRVAGGDVKPNPTPKNPYHCEMCGVSATKASEVMTVKPNPAKVRDPQQ